MKALKPPPRCACGKLVEGVQYQVALKTVCEKCYCEARLARIAAAAASATCQSRLGA